MGFCMLITPYLDGFNVDPETKQVLGVAVEMTRVSLGLADDFANESSPSGSSNLPRRASAIRVVCVKVQSRNYASICTAIDREIRAESPRFSLQISRRRQSNPSARQRD